MTLHMWGCAGPGPRSLGLPDRSADTGESLERMYDTSADGRIDYWQQLAPSGTVALLRFDTNADGIPDISIDRAAADRSLRHLVVMLDSVPFEMVLESWQHGRFRLFEPPRRILSPFPAMTDLSFSELFGCSPSPGVESSYYDGSKLRDGYEVYAGGGNVLWYQYVDYHLAPYKHAFAYVQPFTWYLHELGRIQRRFLRGDQPLYIGYCVGTSGIGAHYGRSGHQKALARLDQFCEYVVQTMRGRVQITMLSDHGHNLVRSRRIPLSDLLEDAGYDLVEHSALRDANDVAVPEFGVVTCAAIHTLRPAEVARDVVGFEGIELAAYFDRGQDAVIVLDRSGRAMIRHSPAAGFSYTCQFGDPLRMLPAWQQLHAAVKVDPQGYASDADVFVATRDLHYPDPLQRLWRAFHGLVEHTPDVYVSVADGWHCGSALMTRLVDISSAHGSLNSASTSGFVMSTAGTLPEVIRMEDLGDELRRIGVPMRGNPRP